MNYKTEIIRLLDYAPDERTLRLIWVFVSAIVFPTKKSKRAQVKK